MPRRFSDSEIADFFTAHFAHRLTALLCIAKRSEQSDFWQGRGDVYCASIEGSFIMFRMFVEFFSVLSHTANLLASTICVRALSRREETQM